MSFDEFADFVESKIAPFTLNESGRSGIALLYNRYPLGLLEECINIGITQYFKYDGNGEPTKESVENFLNKIGGIAYNKSQSPLTQEINHLKSNSLTSVAILSFPWQRYGNKKSDSTCFTDNTNNVDTLC